MKVRILAGFAIAAVVLLALLFLPHLIVAILFLLVALLALFEIFLALHYEYTPGASEMCWCELLIIALAGASIFTELDNFEIGYVIILCALVDVGGYTAGNIAGQRAHRVKALQSISPKKSWEGYAAGVICSVGLGTVFYFLMRQYLPEGALYFCMFAWIPAIFGDLYESKLKRRLQIKDSCEYVYTVSSGFFRAIEAPIKSHGGYMDRIDSFVFTAAAYGLFVSFLP